MANVTQNHSDSLSKDLLLLKQQGNVAFAKKINCSLAEKCLSGCFVYNTQVDRSDINQIENFYDTWEKTSRSVTITMQLFKTKEKSTKLSNYI